MDANDALPLRMDDLLRHRPWVAALARSLVRDEHTAEDLVQDTFVTALERPPSRSGSLRGWLGTVLRNRLRDRHRVETRRARREEAVARRASAPSAAELAERADAHRRLMEAVVALPEPYREAVLLRYQEGLSVLEVAARQGVPASTARTRLARARDRLRSRLDRGGGGDGRSFLLALAPLLESAPAAPHPPLLVGSLGGFLMAHKATIIAVLLTSLLLISVIVSAGGPVAEIPPAPPGGPVPVASAPTPPPAPGDEGAEAKPAGVAEAPAFRLPETGRADGEPVPVPETLPIRIDRDGQTTLGDGGGPTDVEDGTPILVRLFNWAEESRDREHPMQPSERGVVIRADALAPWRAVREALSLAADPDVRIYRVYLAARRGETEVALPFFFPKDRGLARMKTRLLVRPRLRVSLARAAGATAVHLLDRDLGTDEAGLAVLAAALPRLLESAPGAPVAIEVTGDVPYRDLIRVLDLLPAPSATDVSAFRGTAYDLPDGPAGEIDGTVEDLLARFVPEEGDRDRVSQLLERAQQRTSEFHEFLTKCRRSRSLALGLARAYLARGGKEDLLRAVTLGALVSGAESSRGYDRTRWEAEELILRAVLAYARLTGEAAAIELGRSRVEALAALGLLERSPNRAEIERIARDLDALAAERK